MTTGDHDEHERPRGHGSGPISGAGGRAAEPVGEYDDADIPGAGAGRSDEAEGEYTDRDVPGSGEGAAEREGEYTDKDVTDDDTHAPVGSFTDSDIPQSEPGR